MTRVASVSSRRQEPDAIAAAGRDSSNVTGPPGATSERPVLDHFTLRTNDLEGTRAFFEAVLGLKPGYRPAFAFSGYWLYAGGEPVVHLIPGRGGAAARTGETIDHVAFRLADYDGMKRKLDGLAIRYSTMDLPQLGERRLFVQTPTGILLELVFRETLAESGAIKHSNST